jgi:hypothetical protein
MEESMRKLTLVLAAAGYVGLAAPGFTIEKALNQSGPQITDPTGGGVIDELSAQEKKMKKKTSKKKKGTASRSSWGG